MRVQASVAVSSRDLWEDQRWPAFGVFRLAFGAGEQSPFFLPKVVFRRFQLRPRPVAEEAAAKKAAAEQARAERAVAARAA